MDTTADPDTMNFLQLKMPQEDVAGRRYLYPYGQRAHKKIGESKSGYTLVNNGHGMDGSDRRHLDFVWSALYRVRAKDRIAHA